MSMLIKNASHFLRLYAQLFSHEAVAAWGWGDGDDEFGKTAEWKPRRSDAIDTTATVDLTEGQLQLTITERALVPEGDSRTADSEVVFSALASFDEGTITSDVLIEPITDDAVRQMIADFNERA